MHDIAHELALFYSQLEQEAMVKSISAMKNNKKYLEETEKISEGLNSDLPDDGEEWWNKKKS